MKLKLTGKITSLVVGVVLLSLTTISLIGYFSASRVVVSDTAAARDTTTSLENILSAIQEVSQAVSEGASGVQNMAEQTVSVSENTNEIETKLRSIVTSMREIQAGLSKFKVEEETASEQMYH